MMIIVSGFLFLVLLVVVLVIGIVVFRQNRSAASKEPRVDTTQRLEEAIKTYPELRDLAMEAQQKGATHYDYIGAAMFFYRDHEGTVERCFVEYSPALSRYEWIWPSWHADVNKIPQRALLIPDTF